MSSFPCNTFTGGYGEGGYGEGGYGGSGGPAAYYLSLLTSEYQNSTNFLNWLGFVLQIVSDLQQLFCSMDAAFDLDNAIGVQLDVLGQLIGVNRVLGFQPSGGVSPVLDDSTYRLLLKAKILQNQWNGQASSLYQVWGYLFPGGSIIIQDNQNMTATIFLTGAFNSIIQDMIVNDYIVPRPETVQYTFILSTLPVFGFDRNDAYVAGFDTGHFA